MLGQVQDAAEDAVESTLQASSINNTGVESHNLPYSQHDDTLYAQAASSLHERQRGIEAYNHSQANIPAHGGTWPRAFGPQSKLALCRPY